MSNQSLTAWGTDLPFSHKSTWFQVHMSKIVFAAIFVGSYLLRLHGGLLANGKMHQIIISLI